MKDGRRERKKTGQQPLRRAAGEPPSVILMAIGPNRAGPRSKIFHIKVQISGPNIGLKRMCSRSEFI